MVVVGGWTSGDGELAGHGDRVSGGEDGRVPEMDGSATKQNFCNPPELCKTEFWRCWLRPVCGPMSLPTCEGL